MKRRGESFEVELALPERPCLFWYYFLAGEAGETCFYGNAPDTLGGEGCVYSSEPPSYQITVYDPLYAPPAWMREGVMYQIMTDRFHVGGRAVSPPQGHLHANWDEPPELSIDGESGDNAADDFFGGNLRGIEEKLPYLQALGVSVLYLNPIFRARSNHKYDTGDYENVDPSFGTNGDFRRLCEAARARGMRVMLDGVFSHTGSDSRYFDRYGRYGGVGAYCRKDSPFASWYRFERWPDKYDCWWGFKTLPNVNELDPGYLRYIVEGENAIVARWLKNGASGWRLDVADELPVDFLRRMRARVKREAPDCALLGEVWEDASRKVSYGELRSYCLGDTLDSCMNYPLRDGLIAFLLGKMDAYALKRRLDALYEAYPQPFAQSLMNLMGSHDKPRIVNVLSGACPEAIPRERRTAVRLTPDQYALGKRRMLAMWRFLCAMPGMPCLYYGDEAGEQGMDDPFCRGTFPWGREDRETQEAVRAAIKKRRSDPIWTEGGLTLLAPAANVLICRRALNGRSEEVSLEA